MPDTDLGYKNMKKTLLVKMVLFILLSYDTSLTYAQYYVVKDIKCYIATKVVDRNGYQHSPQPGLRMVFGYLGEVDGTGIIELGKIICCDHQGYPLASIISDGGWNVFLDTKNSFYYDLVKRGQGENVYKWKGPIHHITGMREADDILVVGDRKTTLYTVNTKAGETTYYSLRKGNMYINQLLPFTDDRFNDLFY